MPVEITVLESGVSDDDWVEGTSLSNYSAQSVPLTTKIPSAPELLNWNISPQAEHEHIDNYSDRLTRIAQRLAEMITGDEANIGVISLQEVPNDDAWREHFLNALATALGDEEAAKWDLDKNLFHTATHNHEYGNLTLVNSELFDVTNQPNLGPVYEEEDEDAKNEALSRYTAQATDLKLKKKGPTDPDVAFRLVNVHIGENTTREVARAAIERFYQGYTGQVVVAGQFGDEMRGLIPRTGNELQFSNAFGNGFHFRHDPERFEFPQTVLPVVETESPFPSKIKYSELVQKFSPEGFTVNRDTVRDIVTISKDNDEVKIHKTTDRHLSFSANNNSDQALQTLSKAMEYTLAKGTKVKIEVSCADKSRAKDVENTKNEMWLNAVKNGFEVEGFMPSPEFRESKRATLEALPDGANKYFPPSTPRP